MPLTYPQRSNSHQLEEQSERYFRNCLPKNWTCERTTNDYGVDLKVEIFEKKSATGMELLIQLKSSKSSANHGFEKIIIKTTTYNYLWDKFQVVMLVKYVEEENKAYWLLLSEVGEPKQTQKTFTIRIPKKNDLETIDWPKIEEYLKKIKYKKLSVRKRHVFQNTAVP